MLREHLPTGMLGTDPWAGWVVDPSSETSLWFVYCWGKARRHHAPVWATTAGHQHPVSQQPRGTENPDVDSVLSVQRYPLSPRGAAQPSQRESGSRPKHFVSKILWTPWALFQVFSLKAPTGTLPAAMPVPACPRHTRQRCLHKVT